MNSPFFPVFRTAIYRSVEARIKGRNCPVLGFLNDGPGSNRNGGVASQSTRPSADCHAPRAPAGVTDSGLVRGPYEILR